MDQCNYLENCCNAQRPRQGRNDPGSGPTSPPHVLLKTETQVRDFNKGRGCRRTRGLRGWDDVPGTSAGVCKARVPSPRIRSSACDILIGMLKEMGALGS